MMRRSTAYKTKQKEAILAYLSSVQGQHITASQIAAHCRKNNQPVGLTTVYRMLNQLVDEGRIRKYSTAGQAGYCYQYAETDAACSEHYHFKCNQCGELIHAECQALDNVRQHIGDQHHFQIDTSRTVFYGECASCTAKK